MNARDQARYRLQLAEGFLEEAHQDGTSGRWRSCVSAFLQFRGELVATVGENDGFGYYARIYKVKR